MHYVSDEQVDSIVGAGKLDARLGKFKRRLLVYLSGKYRDKDEHSVDCNIHHAKRIAVELWKLGFAVICPHGNSDHMGFEGDDGVFLEGDMVMVERSDIMVMLDNWEVSEGAKLERRLAMRLGIPVYYWSCHQLVLQRLASNDHRYRNARAAILHRASLIGEITGWRPAGVHAGDSTDPGTCDSCGSPRRQGLIAPMPANFGERLEAAFKDAAAREIAARDLCKQSVSQAGDSQWVGAGESKATKTIEPVSQPQPIGD